MPESLATDPLACTNCGQSIDDHVGIGLPCPAPPSSKQCCKGTGKVTERSGGSGWGDGGPDTFESVVDCAGCPDCVPVRSVHPLLMELREFVEQVGSMGVYTLQTRRTQLLKDIDATLEGSRIETKGDHRDWLLTHILDELENHEQDFTRQEVAAHLRAEMQRLQVKTTESAPPAFPPTARLPPLTLSVVGVINVDNPRDPRHKELMPEPADDLRMDELMEIAIRAESYPDPTASPEAATAFSDFHTAFSPAKCVALTSELHELRTRLGTERASPECPGCQVPGVEHHDWCAKWRSQKRSAPDVKGDQ